MGTGVQAARSGVFVGPTSMLVSDGDDHARRRSLVQPAFALRKLQAWRDAHRR